MLSVRARVDFLNLVGILSESHSRMDHLFLEFSVRLTNLLEQVVAKGLSAKKWVFTLCIAYMKAVFSCFSLLGSFPEEPFPVYQGHATDLV